MKRGTFGLSIIAALFAAACSGGGDQDLRDFVKESDQLSGGRIPSLPEPQPSSTQRFDAFQFADPFQARGQAPKLDESVRRSRSVLARYASVEEVDAARVRSRASLESAIAAGKSRIGAIRAGEADLRQKMAGYKDGKKPPQELATALKDHEARLQAAEKDLAARSQELAGLDALFDEDKKRFIELSRKK
jgi:Tfp pilus assembly protein PilP